MLKTVFTMLLTAALLCFALHLVHYDPGTITIAIANVEIHSTLWFFVALLTLFFFLLLLCDRTMRLVGRLGNRSSAQLTQGLSDMLTTGNWPQAAKRFKRLAKGKKQKHLSVFAAGLNHLLHPEAKEDISRLPLLSQVLINLVQSNTTCALRILASSTLPIPPYTRSVLWLTALKQQGKPSPKSLWTFYNSTKDHKKLLKHHSDTMLWLYEQLLTESVEDIKTLWKLWRDMPKALCSRSSIALLMSRQLIHQGLLRDAQQLLEPQWKKHWEPNLLEAYLQTLGTASEQKLWLQKQHEKAPAFIQPHLYAHMGEACLQDRDFDEAYRLLKQAVSHPSTPHSPPIHWQASLALSLCHLKKYADLESCLMGMKK